MAAAPAQSNENKYYDKIGGWLILCAVGLLLYPVQTTVTLFTKILPALQNNWSTLTSPASAAYHPLWGPLLIMELVGSACFLVFSIFVILFFLKRRKFVPKLAVVFMALNLVFVAVDYYLARTVLLEAEPVDLESTVNLIRTLVASVIWIFYFIYSKRVRRTFTQ